MLRYSQTLISPLIMFSVVPRIAPLQLMSMSALGLQVSVSKHSGEAHTSCSTSPHLGLSISGALESSHPRPGAQVSEHKVGNVFVTLVVGEHIHSCVHCLRGE